MNKIYYILFATWCFSLNTYAQATLSQAEYFWDTDPGAGSGFPIAAEDGNFNAIIENLYQYEISAPAPGLHTFNVRVKDSNGQWGPVFKQVIDRNTAALDASAVPVIVQAEYFWDADPGQGNGNTFSAEDGNFDASIEALFQNSIAVPAAHGLHTFSVRVKDSNSQWGPAFTQVIDVSDVTLGTNAVPTVAQVEYFWDTTDPGEGSGLQFSATDGSFNSTLEAFDKAGIAIVGPIGPHIFNVRAKDNNGVWGPLHKNVINIESALATAGFDLANMAVFPNPVKDVLHVSFDKEITAVTVYNILGQQVLSQALNTTDARIDFSGLVSGTYIVRVFADSKVKTLKVIKE